MKSLQEDIKNQEFKKIQPFQESKIMIKWALAGSLK